RAAGFLYPRTPRHAPRSQYRIALRISNVSFSHRSQWITSLLIFATLRFSTEIGPRNLRSTIRLIVQRNVLQNCSWSRTIWLLKSVMYNRCRLGWQNQNPGKCSRAPLEEPSSFAQYTAKDQANNGSHQNCIAAGALRVRR